MCGDLRMGCDPAGAPGEEGLKQLCLARGVRLNGSRRLLLQILVEAEQAPCAEELFDLCSARDSRISRGTVYRTLARLAETGVVNRVDRGRRAYYTVAHATQRLYLRDVASGQARAITDLGVEPVIRQAAESLGYRLLGYRLELIGEAIGPAAVPTGGSAGPVGLDANESHSHYSFSEA